MSEERGRANREAPDDLGRRLTKELRKICDEEGIRYSDADKKPQLIAKIREARGVDYGVVHRLVRSDTPPEGRKTFDKIPSHVTSPQDEWDDYWKDRWRRYQEALERKKKREKDKKLSIYFQDYEGEEE